MKSTFAAIIIATAALLFGSADAVQAGGGYHSNTHYGGQSHCQVRVYKTHTCEVNRYRQCQTRYDHCGKAYTYHVTIVTYRDYYSNGTSRTWTRTLS